MPYSSFIFDNAIAEIIKIIKPKVVLDLGAGAGKYGSMVKEEIKEFIEMTDDDVIIRYEQGDIVGITILHAKKDTIDNRLLNLEFDDREKRS